MLSTPPLDTRGRVLSRFLLLHSLLELLPLPVAGGVLPLHGSRGRPGGEHGGVGGVGGRVPEIQLR